MPKSQGPLLSWHYPASTLVRPCPTPAMAAAFRNVEDATLTDDGSPPITRTTFPTCRAHYPGGSSGCACRLLPTLVGAFPKWQEGRHPHCHFRGLHRLHSVTARRIAQPPKVTFVTRLRPSQLPDQAARQLPDLSTIIRVESSSTGVSRLRGALPLGDLDTDERIERLLHATSGGSARVSGIAGAPFLMNGENADGRSGPTAHLSLMNGSS
jgi:hypothetical protein